MTSNHARRVRSSGASDMGEYAIKWPRHPGEIECVDEQGRVLDLAAAAGAHEASELRRRVSFLAGQPASGTCEML